MNRKIIITALAICLITSLAYASIRMLGQGPIRIGGDGISFYQSSGEHIYISSSADPGGDGSEDLPYDAISDINWTTGDANSIFDWVAAGAKVYINLQGTFDERLRISVSGTASNRITIQGHGTGGTISNSGGDGIVNRKALDAAGDYITIQNLTLSNCDESGIVIGGRTNITLKNLTVSGNANYGIELVTDTTINDHLLIEDITITENTNHGLMFVDAASNTTVKRVVAYSNVDHGIVVRVGTNVTVDSCTAYSNGGDGIIVNPGTNGLVDSCVSYNNSGDGFDVGGTSGSLTHIRCLSYNNASGGFSVKSTGAATSIYKFCIAYGNHEGIEVANSSIVEVYNSTFFDNDYYGYYNEVAAAQTIKNCVFYNNGTDGSTRYQISWLQSGGTLVSDYNVITEQASGRTIYDRAATTTYTLTEWKSAHSSVYDQNSIGTNPDLTSIGKLETGSSAFDVGVAISGTNDVGTLDIWGSAAGTLKNIGAYNGTGYVCSIPSGYEQLVDASANNIYDNAGECIVVPEAVVVGSYWELPRTDYWSDTRESLWGTARNTTP